MKMPSDKPSTALDSKGFFQISKRAKKNLRVFFMLGGFALGVVALLLFAGVLLGPWDHIRYMLFGGEKPISAWDPLRADGCLQFFVWRDLVLDSWSKGTMPTWNPYVFGGAPLAANGQSGALYLPHVLLGRLGVGAFHASILLCWFHLTVAGLGVRYAARAFGARPSAALRAGILFLCSSFLLAWLPLASVPATVCWLPWALGAWKTLSMRTVGEKGPGALFFFSVVMMVSAGHLQFVAYGIISILIVVLGTAHAWAGKSLPTRRKIVLFGVSVATLATSYWLVAPTLRYSEFSHRKTVATAEGYAAYKSSAIQPFEFVGLLLPDLLGSPFRTTEVEPIGTTQEFWPALRKRGANFAESAMGMGPVLLAFLAFLRPRKKQVLQILPILLVGLFGLLAAIGSGVTQAMYFYIPGWAASGSPGRAGVLFLLAMCIYSAMPSKSRAAETEAKKFGIGIVAVIGLIAVAFFVTGQGPVHPVSIVLNVTALLLAAGFMLVRQNGGRMSVPQFGLLAGAMVCQVYSPLAGAPLPGLRAAMPLAREDFLSPTVYNCRVAVEGQGWNLYQTPKSPLAPNLLAIARIPQIGGYDSLVHRDMAQFLSSLGLTPATPQENGNMFFVPQGADLAKLAEAGVGEVWRFENGRRQVTPVPNAWYWKSDSGFGLDYDRFGNGISIRIYGKGPIEVRERYYPGVRAYEDGTEVAVEASGMWVRILSQGSGERTLKLVYPR